MILDALEIYSEKQALASGNSTNVLDHRTKGDAWDNELYLVVQMVEGNTGATGLTVELQIADDLSSGALKSPVTLATSGQLPATELKVGKKCWMLRLPKGMKRYSALKYTVEGTATAGKVTAFLTNNVQHGYEA